MLVKSVRKLIDAHTRKLNAEAGEMETAPLRPIFGIAERMLTHYLSEEQQDQQRSLREASKLLREARTSIAQQKSAHADLSALYQVESALGAALREELCAALRNNPAAFEAAYLRAENKARTVGGLPPRAPRETACSRAARTAADRAADTAPPVDLFVLANEDGIPPGSPSAPFT